VEKPGEGDFRLWVIDLAEARREKPKEEKLLYHLIADPRRARLFTGTDKIRFLKHYLRIGGRNGIRGMEESPRNRRYDMKAWLTFMMLLPPAHFLLGILSSARVDILIGKEE